MSRKSRVDRFVRAIGASTVVAVGKVDHTPIGMVALTEQVKKLRTSGPGGITRPSGSR